MDSNKSTALFEIPCLSAQQGGLWECRVSTNGGQDSRKFNLTIKGLSVWFPLRKIWNNKPNGKHYVVTISSKNVSKDVNFKIIFCVFSEPPVPTSAPKLLEKRSKQLLVMPVDSHRGDGPIVSTRLLYKPVENGDSWSSIIGKQAEISFKDLIW